MTPRSQLRAHPLITRARTEEVPDVTMDLTMYVAMDVPPWLKWVRDEMSGQQMLSRIESRNGLTALDWRVQVNPVENLGERL